MFKGIILLLSIIPWILLLFFPWYIIIMRFFGVRSWQDLICHCKFHALWSGARRALGSEHVCAFLRLTWENSDWRSFNNTDYMALFFFFTFFSALWRMCGELWRSRAVYFFFFFFFFLKGGRFISLFCRRTFRLEWGASAVDAAGPSAAFISSAEAKWPSCKSPLLVFDIDNQRAVHTVCTIAGTSLLLVHQSGALLLCSAPFISAA